MISRIFLVITYIFLRLISSSCGDKNISKIEGAWYLDVKSTSEAIAIPQQKASEDSVSKLKSMMTKEMVNVLEGSSIIIAEEEMKLKLSNGSEQSIPHKISYNTLNNTWKVKEPNNISIIKLLRDNIVISYKGALSYDLYYSRNK